MLVYMLKLLALVVIAFIAIFYFDWALNRKEIEIESQWQKFQQGFGKDEK